EIELIGRRLPEDSDETRCERVAAAIAQRVERHLRVGNAKRIRVCRAHDVIVRNEEITIWPGRRKLGAGDGKTGADSVARRLLDSSHPSAAFEGEAYLLGAHEPGVTEDLLEHPISIRMLDSLRGEQRNLAVSREHRLEGWQKMSAH